MTDAPQFGPRKSYARNRETLLTRGPKKLTTHKTHSGEGYHPCLAYDPAPITTEGLEALPIRCTKRRVKKGLCQGHHDVRVALGVHNKGLSRINPKRQLEKRVKKANNLTSKQFVRMRKASMRAARAQQREEAAHAASVGILGRAAKHVTDIFKRTRT